MPPVATYKRIKTMENFKTIIQKVVAFTYKRWSFREGLKINAVI